jgi:hypothetical protein
MFFNFCFFKFSILKFLCQSVSYVAHFRKLRCWMHVCSHFEPSFKMVIYSCPGYCTQQSACGASTQNRFINVALVDLIGANFLLLVCPICRKWWMVELSTTRLVSIFRDLYKRMLLLLFALSWLFCAKLLEWYFLCPQFVLGLICCSF